MSARLDLVLKKYPGSEEGIRLLASRDPSKNLKYLDWGAKVLASGQALAHEIADVLDLFHKFTGRRAPTLGEPVFRRRGHVRLRGGYIRPDIYTYRPQDLANLRDDLNKIKEATEKKRLEREELYHLEGPIEADVIYNSDDLIVRHIKNKNASCHYGLDTQWCIAMRREGYFEDYETQNAVFFFFERKTPKNDEFDKVALMIPRGDERGGFCETFTADDQRVDMMQLSQVFGPRVFEIFREIHERSVQHPPSAMSRMYIGKATAAELEAVFEKLSDMRGYEARTVLQTICCNDAASLSLLERAREAATRGFSGKDRDRRDPAGARLRRDVLAAMVIHPSVPEEMREGLIKELRRRHVDVATVRREMECGQISVTYDGKWNRRRSRSFRERCRSPSFLRARAKRFDRMAIKFRKQARTAQRKLTAAKKRKAKRDARRRA